MKQKYLQIFTGFLLITLVLSGCSVFETQNESQTLTRDNIHFSGSEWKGR